MKLLLTRKDESENGTDGELKLPSGAKICTLELPWRDNNQNESCIPRGIYQSRRVNSPKFGNTFEVCNVPNRSNILFHKGNKEADTKGCILVGLAKMQDQNGKDIIAGSAAAFDLFKIETSSVDEFELEIR